MSIRLVGCLQQASTTSWICRLRSESSPMNCWASSSTTRVQGSWPLTDRQSRMAWSISSIVMSFTLANCWFSDFEISLTDAPRNAFGQAAAGALLSEELQNSIQEFRIRLVGRHGFALDVFGDTPTGNHYGPPSTSFGWRQPPFGGGCAPARYARLRSAAPEGGLGGGKKSNLQNYVYTNMPSIWLCGGFRWLKRRRLSQK